MVYVAPANSPVRLRELTSPDQPHLGPQGPWPGAPFKLGPEATISLWAVPYLSLQLLRGLPPSPGCLWILGQGGLLVRRGILHDLVNFFSFMAPFCSWGSSALPPRTEERTPAKSA